jgi:hypoxanthine-guanine phosphoribosyltransferase
MLSNNKYEVTVQSNTITTHIVSLSDEVHKNLTNNKVTKEELLDFSFKFLLDREPNTSIMSSFELTVISRYFSEYENSVEKWCSS